MEWWGWARERVQVWEQVWEQERVRVQVQERVAAGRRE
jgi:hypothetical protein